MLGDEQFILYEDVNSHLLTLTQLAEESTALTVCPFDTNICHDK